MLVTRYNPYINLLQHHEVTKEEGSVASFVPAVNTREGEKAYYIELDVPGMKKEDIEITAEENMLTISGERKRLEEAKEDYYYQVESHYGTFSRSFTLPQKVDIEKIEAHFENGVLEVVIPKLSPEATQPKKIHIQ
jgi:HSP20 family protein